MSEVTWKPTLLLPQDPDATLDYVLDFAPYLEGDTIATATVAGQRCTALKHSSDDTTVTLRVSAVAGNASAVVSIVRASGQLDERTVRFTSQDH